MTNETIIYVHLNDTSRKQQDYFFGSILAIYDVFTEKELGIKYDSLLVALKPKGTYTNPFMRVIVGKVIRRKWSRNGKRDAAE